MITKISTMGSCSSRNIFNSLINKNYKDFFRICRSMEGVTIISLMSKPLDFDKALINSSHEYDNACVIDDLSKQFLEFLKNSKIDYLVIDTFFDAFFDVIYMDENTYVSDSYRIQNTDFYKLLSDKRRISIIDDFEEYYNLYTNAFDSFFNFVNTFCDFKVILNCSRSVYKYQEGNKLAENVTFKERIPYNEIRDRLDTYILENFDIEVLPFDSNTLADKNHIFGFHHTHYEPKYYSEKNQQINDIIKRNNELSFDNPINKKFRELQRNNTLLKFKNSAVVSNREFNSDIKKRLIKEAIFNDLAIFNTARIDIKNNGSNQNTIKIKNSSDTDFSYQYPDWFKDGHGWGLVIHSKCNFLEIDLECVGDGEIEIGLKGMDAKINAERIPIYINYTKLRINDEVIFDENKLAWHDKPYGYKFSVKNNQLIHISIEWTPISFND